MKQRRLAGVPSSESSLVERLLKHIAEISAGSCSITDTAIEAESDPNAQAILVGLMMLHEDLQFGQQRQSMLLDEARGAIRARDEFLSVAGHELRTPITTLALQVQGLERVLSDKAPPELLSSMSRRLELTRRQVDRLVALVATLIDVSRINSARVEVSREPAELIEILRSAMERLADHASHAGSSLTLEDGDPIRGHFDVSRVDQVATNLLMNAIRYGRGNPILIRTSGDDGRARFAVEDRGIGIAPEHQARIFLQYERAAPATNYAGLGLGLWISRHLVEAMGGNISFLSEVDVGSVFMVDLPRAG
jgi:two-component system OmpR family sensor kinase